MDKKKIEMAAEEYADKHFLEDVEILMSRPWPEAKEHYKQMLIRFATSTLSHQWIPVEKELPEDNQRVLALCVGGCMQLGYYDYSDELWFIDGFGAFNRDEIDFWMPIPAYSQLNSEKDER